MPSKYPGGLIEVQPEVLVRTTQEWNDHVDELGVRKVASRYLEHIYKKNHIYLNSLVSFEQVMGPLCTPERLDQLLENAYLSYRLIEAQHEEESLEMPRIDELTYQKIFDDFSKNLPNTSDWYVTAASKMCEENWAYYVNMEEFLRSHDNDLLKSRTKEFYAFRYLLLSQQARSDYEKLVSNN